jgi:hypothetical protein
VGDNFQIIADVEATEAEAQALAASVVNWLATTGIIAGDPVGSTLGTRPCYPPGPHYAAAVTSPDDTLAGLRANGVEVHTTRTVFHPVQGEMGPVACPRCGQVVVLEDPATGELTDNWATFSDALGQWHAGGPALAACPHCRRASGVNDWQWIGDWPIAVGFLGFTFWNWPVLSASFVTQVEARLGHRVVVTKGKL